MRKARFNCATKTAIFSAGAFLRVAGAARLRIPLFYFDKSFMCPDLYAFPITLSEHYRTSNRKDKRGGFLVKHVSTAN